MPGTPLNGNATNTFAIDNTQRYSVLANTQCRRIYVQENYDSAVPPTADLLMASPAGAAQILVAKGTPCVFTAKASDASKGLATFTAGAWEYVPGVVVGEIETVSGTITVQQLETNQV